MENENNSIHDFDFNLICEYFSSLERQGPGSTHATIKALSFIKGLTKESIIADIGCGTGGQTITMAQNIPGKITGLDLFQEFITKLNNTAVKLDLQDRVKGITGSMDKLPFKNNEFDLIWSEGAIYNIGFQKGLKEWHKFLKPEGYIAVSDASWFTRERPKEIEDFWQDAYPEIDTIGNKIKQMEENNYIPVASFILPQECWTENFYIPQISAQEKFLQKYKDNKTAHELIKNQRREADLYSKYKDFYGYVFYIGQKIL